MIKPSLVAPTGSPPTLPVSAWCEGRSRKRSHHAHWPEIPPASKPTLRVSAPLASLRLTLDHHWQHLPACWPGKKHVSGSRWR